MPTFSALHLFNIAVIVYWITNPLRNYPPHIRMIVDLIILIESLFELMYMLS